MPCRQWPSPPARLLENLIHSQLHADQVCILTPWATAVLPGQITSLVFPPDWPQYAGGLCLTANRCSARPPRPVQWSRAGTRHQYFLLCQVVERVSSTFSLIRTSSSAYSAPCSWARGGFPSPSARHCPTARTGPRRVVEELSALPLPVGRRSILTCRVVLRP